ncbi:MAG: double-strand break repair helicase AddA, partial [Alphaproteobacteria bacterium]|nr:double-strand break repair helicase AddA [Alphaproteobacteria bacterium]
MGERGGVVTARGVTRTTPEQRRASAVGASVWVDASAGTGKTKVLTDRVLALMLSGTRAEAILCLTFTKTAAAEMTNRILHVLGRWSTMDDAALAPEVADILGHEPDVHGLRSARRLFAAVLDLPGGLRVETIHAFCDALLRRFPIEAGLVPHFEVLDSRTADEMMAQAEHALIRAARTDADGPLAAAFAVLTRDAAEDRFDRLMKALVADRRRLKRMLDGHGGIEGAAGALRTRLGLGAGEDEATIIAEACAETAFDGAGLRAAVQSLETGSKTDTARAEAMAPWLAAPAQRADLFDEYCGAFLTKEEEARSSLITRGAGGEDSAAGRALRAEAIRLAGVRTRVRAARLAERTVALLRIGGEVLARYEAHKARRAVLDFDDLVLGARRLLERAGAAAWVLYKLDGGIDHILIDEAQDTNPDQWAVVRAIAEEFFAGEGARAVPRTIFAVGDAKQSIFSFQRADPDAFAAMRDHFAARVAEAGRSWDAVDLTVSFRSTPAVLAAVDAVFAAGLTAADGVVAAGATISHRAERVDAPGLV